jgi:radical SAM superfamily enzyme YgiQ (UPF0313 family)
MYTGVFLRLEPLGLELVAAAARDAGHQVRIIDLQVEPHEALTRILRSWAPDAVCFSGNYLANVPEIVDLAKSVKAVLPRCFVFVGGHSVSFVAEEILRHGEGVIDCVLRGEGEAFIGPLLSAVEAGADILQTPGVVTAAGQGPIPHFVDSLDRVRPGAGPAAAPAQLLHRHAGSGRLHRVLARLSLGLHLLQRLDLLRPQLSHQEPRGGRRGTGADP